MNIIGKQNPAEGFPMWPYRLFLNKPVSGPWQLFFSMGGGGSYVNQFTTSSGITPGAWHHVVAVLANSPTGKKLRLYVNGALKVQGPFYGTLQSTHTGPVFIGVKDMGIFMGISKVVHQFKGRLDEISIYDNAMSAEEIAARYNQFQAMFPSQ